MTFLLIDDGEDRDRWLRARAATPTTVSATDAARIMTGGAGTWASLRKEKATGASFGGNIYTQHGREREAAIAEWAQTEFGLAPSKALIGHTDAREDLATPDGLSTPLLDALNFPGDDLRFGLNYRVEEFGEYKTTKKDWPSWSDVPARYFWQVVWQFRVTGARRCRFVFEPHEGFVPLYMEPRVFTIERTEVEDDIAKAVVRIAEWRAAEAAEVPDALLPLDGLLTLRERAKDDAKDAESRIADAEAQMRALLAAHGKPYEFEGTDAALSWTGERRTSERFDSMAFKARYPRAFARFTKTTTEKQPRLGITTRS